MPTGSSAKATERPQRDSRLSLRASSYQRQLIDRAAAALDKTVTDFVLDSAAIAAEQVLADRRWFMLDEEEWARFERLIDEPIEPTSKLARLLSEATVFDEG